MFKLQACGPVIVRLALSLVFLSFSYLQFSNPGMWGGVVPKFVSAMVGGNAGLIVSLNAWFELLAGLMLIIGFHTRAVALLLALHLFGIASSFGFSPIGIRDFGLAFATLSIFFTGMDVWCLDQKFTKKAEPVSNI
jgi:uncharacterized membrane protein YphA (DoxX/SURF4 family)